MDILVYNELRRWTDLCIDHGWGACPKENIRIIDGKTGEWIDYETSGAYEDNLDTNGGEH